MKRAGTTLVELMAALAVTAVIATIACKLLFAGFESWRVQADRESARRNATLALDQLAKDLASQPEQHGLADPVESFSLGESSKKTAFFLSAENGLEISVCWYLSGNSPWTLRRIVVDTDVTESALPSNAAGEKADSTESNTDDEESSIITCRGILSLEYKTPDGADVPQLLLKMLTPEGTSRIADGESESNLPERCVLTCARPVR